MRRPERSGKCPGSLVRLKVCKPKEGKTVASMTSILVVQVGSGEPGHCDQKVAIEACTSAGSALNDAHSCLLPGDK